MPKAPQWVLHGILKVNVLLLLMTILTKSFLALVCRHLMAFTFFSARHSFNSFQLNTNFFKNRNSCLHFFLQGIDFSYLRFVNTSVGRICRQRSQANTGLITCTQQQPSRHQFAKFQPIGFISFTCSAKTLAGLNAGTKCSGITIVVFLEIFLPVF